MKLSSEQKKRIQENFQSGEFNTETEISTLVREGILEEHANLLLKEEAGIFREKMFKGKLKSEDTENKKSIALVVILLLGIAGHVFNLSFPLWYIGSSVVAGAIGFFVYRETPISGILGAIMAVLLLPITLATYTEGRSTIFNIELIIPIGIAIVPSYIVYYFSAKMIYPPKKS